MKKLRKILKLSDPSLNLWDEFFSYIKAVLGTSFFILGIFLVFHPLFYKISFFGVLETGLTPTGLEILSFLDSIIYPKGYFGFLVWGVIVILIGIFFFLRIKLVRRLVGK